MLDDLKLWWKEKRIDREYDKLRNKDDEGSKVRSIELIDEHAQLQEDRLLVVQRKLLAKADRLLISRPAYEEKETWDVSQMTGRYMLKRAYLNELRNKIREEQKARRDLMIGWITPIIGLIGALTGLFAVLFR